MLLRGLPVESRTVTAQIDRLRDETRPKATGPAPTPRWGHHNWQLADLVDAVRRVEYALIAVNLEKGKAPKQPKPLPRPTDPREEVVQSRREKLWERMKARVRIAPRED